MNKTKMPVIQNPFGSLMSQYNLQGLLKTGEHLLQKVPVYVWVFLVVAVCTYVILFMWWFFYRGVKP